jgi:hypothetical protein
MRLLPLVPSAHASSWYAVVADEGPGLAPPARAACRFCGWTEPGWLELFHLNGDHEDAAPGNLVWACVLCHLHQHLDRPQIEQEAALIWLPDMSPAAVVALARHCHLVLTRHDRTPGSTRRKRRNGAAVAAAETALKALLAQRRSMEIRLGTASPRDLGAALLGLAEDVYALRSDLLAGIRLLPLGRYFRDGTDIYPQLLLGAARQGAHQPGREDQRC